MCPSEIYLLLLLLRLIYEDDLWDDPRISNSCLKGILHPDSLVPHQKRWTFQHNNSFSQYHFDTIC